MLKYKAIIADNKDFDAKIIQPLKDNLKQGDAITWLQDADKFYSMDMLSYILKNAYNERYIRYDTEDEFIGYFSNIFLTVTPMFYSKVSNIIEDKLKELQDNKNVGIKTNVTSESDRGTSGRAFDNTVGDDKQTATETSKYVMDSRSDNMLDNAKKLAQSKISGEVTLYVASFAELFSTLDIEDNMDKSFTPALIAILSDIAMAVTTLGHTEVSDGQGGFVNLIDFNGRLMTEQAVTDDITNAIKRYDDLIQKQLVDTFEKLNVTILRPLSNRVTHIGANQIVQKDGSEIGFDDDTPQKVYSKESSDEYRTVKDLTHLTTQDEIYNAVKSGGIYKITVSNQVQLLFCPTKTNTQVFIKALVTKQDDIELITQTATKGSTSNFNWLVSTMIVATPTHDNHAATKKYVDVNKYSLPSPIIHKNITDLNPYDSDIEAANDRGDNVSGRFKTSDGYIYDGNMEVVIINRVIHYMIDGKEITETLKLVIGQLYK